MNAPLILPRHKLTVDDYHAMAKAGILNEDNRVELIEGELIDMAPIGSLHNSKVALLTHLFHQQVDKTALVFPQNSLRLSRQNEPQPDLMLLRPRKDWYQHALPTSEDVLLLIEVADTTIERDREFKCPLYAKYGIAELWLVDLGKEKTEVYREPQAEGYKSMMLYRKNDNLAPLLLPEVKIELRQLWPD